MVRLLGSRLASAALIMFLASILIFVVVTASGDPLTELRERQPPVPESAIQAEEVRLGLDQNPVQRYLGWITGIASGDFGPSVIVTRDIGDELMSRIGVTMRLVVVAIAIAFVLAFVIGTVSALYRRRLPDLVLTPMTFLFLAMPSFWLAVLLKHWAVATNNATGYQIFATVGANSVPPPQGFWAVLTDTAAHLVLPTIVLALMHAAVWNRYQRTAVTESLTSDHLRFGVLKGLSRSRLVSHYAVRPALVPVVTIIALDLPLLLSGAIVTETVFQWRGMGDFLLESIQLRDVNSVLAWLLIAAGAVIIFNLIADLLYAAIDPRVRYDR